MRSAIAKYFAWFVFVGALLIAPNLLSVVNTVRSNHFSWVDVFATTALLFGPVTLVASLAGALLLALLEHGTRRRNIRWVSQLAGFIAFTVFLYAWLRLLRGTLKFNKVEAPWVDRPFEKIGSLVIGVLLFVVIPRKLADWVHTTARRLRPIGWACTACLVGLIGYLVLEPLNRGTTGPVQLPERGKQQPNVIVIVLDSLVSLDMSLYGYKLPTTPRLDELTKTWTVFENAHSANTATAAVQPAMLTGRYPYSDRWQQYGDLAQAGKGLLSLPRILQASGYETIYVMGGGWPPSRYHFHTGFDQIIGGGFAEFQRPSYAVHRFPYEDLLNRTLWNPTIAEVLLSWRLKGPGAPTSSYDEPLYKTAMELFAR